MHTISKMKNSIRDSSLGKYCWIQRNIEEVKMYTDNKSFRTESVRYVKVTEKNT